MQLGEIAIVTGGVVSVGVSIGHAFFDRLLGWGDDLAQMKPGNRTVLYTIHVALYLLFLPFAIVSIAYPAELVRPGGVGGTIALSYAAFWAWRLVWQVVYFRKLARESRRWRTIHPVLLGLLAVMVAVYAGPALAAWLGAA
jgi:hypothetical protein